MPMSMRLCKAGFYLSIDWLWLTGVSVQNFGQVNVKIMIVDINWINNGACGLW